MTKAEKGDTGPARRDLDVMTKARAWWRTNWRSLILAVLGCALAAYLVAASDSVQQCFYHPPLGNTGHAANDGIRVLGFTMISRHCIGVFLHDNGEAVIAVGTLVLAYVTYRLWSATLTLATDGKHAAAEQSGLTRRAIRLSRMEFISTHRPRLIVRRVTLRDELREGDDDPRNKMATYAADYEIVNVGATPATIVQATSTRSMLPTPRAWVPNDAIFTTDGDGVVGRKLISGESCLATCDDERLIHSAASVHRGHAPFSLYFMGHIAYTDSVGLRRKTGFLRRYDSQERVLVRVDNPDYEYAD